jgi:hypothetical protein
MGIDHRGPHVTVSEQRLDGADIVVRLQEMGGEGMAESMRRDPLRKLCPANSTVERLLQILVGQMIPPLLL